MRRGRREKRINNNSIANLIYISGGILLVIFIAFIITFLVYNKKLKEYSYSSLTTEKIADLVSDDIKSLNDNNTELEQASSEIGKSIEEAIEKIGESKKEKEEKEEKEEKVKEIEEKENVEKKNKYAEESLITNVEQVKEKDPEFSNPVEGEIIRSFAKESLIYSDTLEEWVTHLGIDIKAERTTVVNAAESGVVSSIKNDPRYGLTVVVEHVNSFKTVYSNLLTTEFVSEGLEIEKGQAIGTVGNSAAFEIVDEPHLHFEILKDGESLDPTIYLK